MYSQIDQTTLLMSAKAVEVRTMKNTALKSKRERVQYLVDLEIRLLKKYRITKDDRTMGLIKNVREEQIKSIKGLKINHGEN